MLCALVNKMWTYEISRSLQLIVMTFYSVSKLFGIGVVFYWYVFLSFIFYKMVMLMMIGGTALKRRTSHNCLIHRSDTLRRQCCKGPRSFTL